MTDGESLDFVVDQDVFAEIGDDLSNVAVVIISPTPDAAAEALARAAKRILVTDEYGHEYADYADYYAQWQEGPNEAWPYTPNWASPPLRDPVGPILVIDAHGWIAPAMAEQILVIIREELERAGVRRARLATPVLTDDDSVLWFPERL